MLRLRHWNALESNDRRPSLPLLPADRDNTASHVKQYKDLVGRYQILPLAKNQALDIDEYVTSKAIDGLFYYVGEEEKKIRKNPAARVTQILKDVFGRVGK